MKNLVTLSLIILIFSILTFANTVEAVNRAITFDGNGDYVEVTQDIPETNLTVEFWFKTTAASGGMFAVQLGKLGGSGHDRHIYMNNGSLRQRVWSNETITSTNSGFNDGAWHHYAMVIQQGVGQKMYVDGNLEASGGKDRSDFTNQDRFVVGFSNDINPQYFNGQIDDLRIWNVAKLQWEIQALKDIVLTGNESGLIGYWRFDDEPDSPEAVDSSPEGHNGTLFGEANFVDSDAPINPISADADILVIPTDLDFGNTMVGESIFQTITVFNRGGAKQIFLLDSKMLRTSWNNR